MEGWWWAVVAAGCYLAGIVGVHVCKVLLGPGFHVKGKHVFITGGSAGLGLAFAQICAKKGAHVTIVARSEAKLQAAKKALEGVVPAGSNQKILALSCDVADTSAVQATVQEAVRAVGSLDVVVCNAGLSQPGYMVDQPVDIYRQQMDINYFGTLYTTKAALPHLLASKGRLVFVSSAAALTAVTGYSQYCATKYAVRGLCDVLRQEMKAHGVDVHIFFPSSIDTEGFAEEEKTKPKATREIEGAASLLSATQCADILVSGLSLGHYAITSDLLMELARVLSNGICPRNNTLLEWLLLPVAGLVGLGFNVYTDHVAVKHAHHVKTD